MGSGFPTSRHQHMNRERVRKVLVRLTVCVLWAVGKPLPPGQKNTQVTTLLARRCQTEKKENPKKSLATQKNTLKRKHTRKHLENAYLHQCCKYIKFCKFKCRKNCELIKKIDQDQHQHKAVRTLLIESFNAAAYAKGSLVTCSAESSLGYSYISDERSGSLLY